MAKVYISATRLDLTAECTAVAACLTDMGHEPMDSYAPDSQAVLESCLADIALCDLFVLILGHRSGHRPAEDNPENLTITDLEFRYAGDRSIPRVVLQQSGIPHVEHADIFDPIEMEYLRSFHSEVGAAVRTSRFADCDQLIRQLAAGVTGELRKLGQAPSAVALHQPLRRASRDLLAWRTTLPDGDWLERPEQEVIRQRIRMEPRSVTLLLGEPGCGKSALLARLGKAAQDEGLPVLGIKADLLPAATLTPQDLMNYLELPLSVLATVNALAEAGPVLVLVDQLDALADLVVQHSARLRVLLNLVRDLDERPNVHVVASCRAFEQRHDPSLRNIAAYSLTLELPPWAAVDIILRRRGVHASGWNPEMRETLRSPHALDTFLSLLGGDDEVTLADGFHGILQLQWKGKVLCDACGGRKSLVLDIAEHMADRETLWLPLSLVEDRHALVQELLAAGLLIEDKGGGQIAFRHQTLYEFVRARSFLAAGRLTETVLAGQSSLRIRPQFWHALVYLRRVVPETYQDELRQLWGSPIRPHLRMLLIEFLGTQAVPLPEEVSLAFRNFDDPWFQRRFLNAVAGSVGWFNSLLRTHLPMLMARSTQEAAVVLPILDRALFFSPQAVQWLLDAHWIPDPEKDWLSWRLLAFGPLEPVDVTWVERLEHIVSRTELNASVLSHVVSEVSAVLPGEAPRLVAAWLARQWRELKGRIECDPIDVDDSIDGDGSDGQGARRRSNVASLLEGRELDCLPAIAEAAPRQFIQVIWPLLLETLEVTSDDANPFVVGYRENPFLINGFDNAEESRLASPLGAAIASALDAWAVAESDVFVQFVATNAGRDLLPVQCFLARGLIHCAAEHSAVLLEFLCGDPRRLVPGPYSDPRRHSRALIEAVAPHLDDAQYLRLEQTIVSWHRYNNEPHEDAETKRRHLLWNRQDRLRLLRALPERRMSPSARRLIHEEERAFPDTDECEWRMTGTVVVSSRVSAEQMCNSRDEDILNFFGRLTDEHAWNHPQQWMKGGAVAAGRQLGRLAERDPDRAVRLVRHLQPEQNEIPVGEVIRKLLKAGYDHTDLFALIEELNAKGFSRRAFRESCVAAIEDAMSAKHSIPEELLCVLEGWLVSVDPAPENVTDEKAVRECDESLLWGRGSISWLPSGNFPALAALSRACVLSSPPLVDRWLDILDAHLSRRETSCVWKALSGRHLRWLHLTAAGRAQTFLDRLFSEYPDLLGSRDGVNLMAALQGWVAPENAARWLEVMARAGTHGAQGCGEVLMLRHALFPEEDWPRELLHTLLASNDSATREQRTGIAHAVVNLWSETQHRCLAHSYLLPLLATTEEDVVQAVGGIFLSRAFPPDQPTRELLNAMCEHAALLRDQRSQHLVKHLDMLMVFEPALVARLANALVDQSGEAMRSTATSWSLRGESLMDIALRLQDMGEPYPTAGLELFERMLEFNLPHVQEMALSLDKRTVNDSAAARPSKRRR